jgi:hypothetical protein
MQAVLDGEPASAFQLHIRDNRSTGIKQIFTDFARSSFSAVALPSPRQRHRIS